VSEARSAGRSRGAEGPLAALGVAELVARVQGTLARNLDRVWVVGEISNLRLAPSGHAYFTLKDAQAQISTVLFRGTAQTLRVSPSDGLEVVVRGRVTVYEPRGQLQLVIDSLEPRGLGALRQELERRRAKLAAEGLLDPARKRPLPFLPRRVGLVTALRGAAIHDMLVTMRRRFPAIAIVVRPVRVQGMGAEVEIAAAIREIQSVADLDVMIVGRGGGSVEDLWAFNDEGVARAIVASRVPVVSAVGHEIDVTLADLAADCRCATPTAAAERVVPRLDYLHEKLRKCARALDLAMVGRIERARRAVVGLRGRLRDPRRDVALASSRSRELAGRLERAARARLESARGELDDRRERLRAASPAPFVERARRSIDRAQRTLETAIGLRVRRLRERWATVAGHLSGLSPLAALERGYSIVWRSGESRALRSVGGLAAGDRVEARLASGGFVARIESIVADLGVLGEKPSG
jgi:exodeoxyribonuclease VII large subunit